jgi:predicted methyltransferase
MRLSFASLAAPALFAVVAMTSPLAFAADAPKNVAAAVADTGRPEADTKRDADRKPAELLAFTGVKPGDKVLDLIAGGGYFTRLLSGAVGPNGAVYMFNPTEFTKNSKNPIPANGSKPDPARQNITFVNVSINELKVPEKVDLVWTSQNYHDLHKTYMGEGFDIAKFNKVVFDALKPGGTFIVLDHAAKAGSGRADIETLHRIDEATVRKEVEAAGFKYEGSLDVLRNKSDDHAAKVFDPAIRGKTDQFVLKFRKPS